MQIDLTKQDELSAIGRSGISIISFDTEIVTKKAADGTLETATRDYVTYAPSLKLKGLFDTRDPVDVLLNPREIKGAGNVASMMAIKVKNSIEPAYRAWKGNQSAPEYGTPITAWTAIPQSYRDIIMRAGVTSIEQLADATSSVLSLPGLKAIGNLKEIQENARRFVNAKDVNKSAAIVAMHEDRTKVLEDQLAEQAKMMEEMRGMMAEMMADKVSAMSGADDSPKRRGRPPKSATDHEALADEAA